VESLLGIAVVRIVIARLFIIIAVCYFAMPAKIPWMKAHRSIFLVRMGKINHHIEIIIILIEPLMSSMRWESIYFL